MKYMQLRRARDAWGRAERVTVRLGELAEGSNHQAFEDLLPYVLDLLAGVRRQVHEYQPRTAAFDAWWPSQKTADREAITEMRHAQLKRLERRAQRQLYAHTFSSQGTFKGKVVNSGDTAVWWTWHFIGGRFDGQEVMAVLHRQLGDLETLIADAEKLL